MRLVKANVNELLNKAEDPEKMLNQIVEDMQKELVEFRQTYAEVAANTKRLEKQMVQAEGLKEEWLKRAKLALEKGDEEAARAALERKNQQEETANSLRAQVESQSGAVQQLFSQMQELEQKISDAKAKKDQLKARAQTAKTSTKINDMLSKSSSTGAMDAFNRMEEKVEQMEAQSEVAAALSGDSSLDKRFKELEAGSKVTAACMSSTLRSASRRAFSGMYCGVFLHAFHVFSTACYDQLRLAAPNRCVVNPNTQVDDDLAALKGMISGSSAEPPKALPSDPKVDDELQKMKDMLKDK